MKRMFCLCDGDADVRFAMPMSASGDADVRFAMPMSASGDADVRFAMLCALFSGY